MIGYWSGRSGWVRKRSSSACVRLVCRSILRVPLLKQSEVAIAIDAPDAGFLRWLLRIGRQQASGVVIGRIRRSVRAGEIGESGPWVGVDVPVPHLPFREDVLLRDDTGHVLVSAVSPVMARAPWPNNQKEDSGGQGGEATNRSVHGAPVQNPESRNNRYARYRTQTLRELSRTPKSFRASCPACLRSPSVVRFYRFTQCGSMRA